MTARKAQKRRVSCPQGTSQGTIHLRPAGAKGGFICSPNHHCSISLESDRAQRRRLPERRRLPRKGSL